MKKKQLRMIVDIAMTVLLPMLMAYSLIGEKFHEIVGTLMLALFIAHHVINRGWHAALCKGKYTVRRILRTILDMLLFVFMILQPLSGILISKHLYTFIEIQGVSAWARGMHMCLAYWGYVLLCVHAGIHLTAAAGQLRRKHGAASLLLHAVWAVISGYGCYALYKRGLAEYMFRKTAFAFFDFSEPGVFFLMDYAAVMLLFMFVGYIAASRR